MRLRRQEISVSSSHLPLLETLPNVGHNDTYQRDPDRHMFRGRRPGVSRLRPLIQATIEQFAPSSLCFRRRPSDLSVARSWSIPVFSSQPASFSRSSSISS